MDVIRKDATITNTDDAFPGTFQVVLSAPTKDRDGETLLPEEWKQPLPDHITFDIDHGMSVATTVGSGKPRIDEKGQIVVSGTYSSLPRAQDTRTLVKEGHIRTTSVAFMTERSTNKDGKTSVTRELLNGAFVAIPSNREALVLAAKGLKAGARNSATDMDKIQQIHDLALQLGASSTIPEQDLVKALARKAASVEDQSDQSDPTALLSGVDAAIDEAIGLFAAVDVTALPAEVQQAIALIQAADATVDELLEALGIPDPDEEAANSGADNDAAAAKAAAASKSAPVEEADSHEVTDEELGAKALEIIAAQFII